MIKIWREKIIKLHRKTCDYCGVKPSGTYRYWLIHHHCNNDKPSMFCSMECLQKDFEDAVKRFIAECV